MFVSFVGVVFPSFMGLLLHRMLKRLIRGCSSLVGPAACTEARHESFHDGWRNRGLYKELNWEPRMEYHVRFRFRCSSSAFHMKPRIGILCTFVLESLNIFCVLFNGAIPPAAAAAMHKLGHKFAARMCRRLPKSFVVALHRKCKQQM